MRRFLKPIAFRQYVEGLSQGSQCEAKCVRGIKGESVGIGRLERFAADWSMKNAEKKYDTVPFNGKRSLLLDPDLQVLPVQGIW